MAESNFVPLDEDDLKHALEIPVKYWDEASLTTIEKQGGQVLKRKNNETKIEKIKEKKKDKYILVITEKPQAAMKIASALGNPRKLSYLGVPYYELTRNGKRVVVACAVGHLFTISQKSGKGYPVFDVEWKANYLVKKADWSKKYYSALVHLVKNASSFIIATDYDIEGEVIGLNIVRFIAKQKDASRMKYSSLTKEELENAYDNAKNTLDWGQAIAGETRHYLDWFYGINLSRALMAAIKKAGNFRIMSVGRVQGPALHLVVDKEKQILAFKPETYWQVFALVNKILLKYTKDITKKEELDKFKKLEGREGEAKTIKKSEKISPPAPFDLTTLQTEAYKFFKINPARTLQIAQSLYLAGVISYPRTSSQKLPEAIGYKKILSRLDKSLTSFVSRTKPVEGGKSDPAHPAIYPTGERGEFGGDEKRVYELIMKRFISCFCSDALVESKKIEFIIDGLKFDTRGLEIKDKGWMNVYPASLFEKELKDLNGKYKIEKIKIEEKETQPPKRYSPASLVAELAKRNLGTKATRAAIVETLYSRNYIKGQNSIEATPLGMGLIDALEKHSPIIIDEKLTRKIEKEMDSLNTIKKDLDKKQKKILEEAKQIITKISDKFKKDEETIGKDLVKANESLREIQKEEAKVMPCPVCKQGNLAIKFSPRFKKSFIACDKYPDCKTTFSLPSGLIKKTEKLCDKCSWPLLIRLAKGRRPWIFCFNPNCESRKEYESKKSEKEGDEKEE